MKYNVICSDPAWSFSDPLKNNKEVKRSAESQYQVMSLTDIAAMDVHSLADPKWCVLALWVPNSMVSDGLQVMKSWGFEQKQIFNWDKIKKEPLKELKKQVLKSKSKAETAELFKNFDLNTIFSFGMGRMFRAANEIALIGVSGKDVYKNIKNLSQRNTSLAQNEGHSIKPDILQDRLMTIFPEAKYLELFARRHKAGWYGAGNEICGGEDIRTSIDNLKNDINLERYLGV